MRPRVMPVLLVEDEYVVKTRSFRKPTYVGDPINSVKIFNEKEADELVVLDITASSRPTPIDFAFVEDVVSEAFMPVAYGGGIRTFADVERLVSLGVEKVIMNTVLFSRPEVLTEVASAYGAQAVVAAVDVATSWSGRTSVATQRGRKLTGKSAASWAGELARRGAGEIILTSVAREGTRTGFDLALIDEVSRSVDVPVIAHGGAGSLTHLREAVQAGASAVAAGSLFVHHGERRAVLLTYPTDDELNTLFQEMV